MSSLVFHWLFFIVVSHWILFIVVSHWLFSSPFTYDIHMEATRTLLVLLSGQMFSTNPSTPSPFLQSVMATHM